MWWWRPEVAASELTRWSRRRGVLLHRASISVGRGFESAVRRRLRPLQSPATTIFSLSFPTLSSSLCRLGISSRGDR